MKIALIVLRGILSFVFAGIVLGSFLQHHDLSGAFGCLVLFILLFSFLPASWLRRIRWLPSTSMEFSSDLTAMFVGIRWFIGTFMGAFAMFSITQPGGMIASLFFLLMGLFCLSPFGDLYFSQYRSLVRKYSVRPEYRTGLLLAELWWLMGLILYNAGAIVISGKPDIGGTIMLGYGIILLCVNPMAYKHNKWVVVKPGLYAQAPKWPQTPTQEPQFKVTPKTTSLEPDFVAAPRSGSMEPDFKADPRTSSLETDTSKWAPKRPSLKPDPPEQTKPVAPPDPVVPAPAASAPIEPTPVAESRPPAPDTPPPAPAPSPSPEVNALLQMIRKGENSKVEFKSTLRVDVRTNKPEKYIQHSVLKTIAAFLNSQGGTLLIGVDDEKNILGLDRDLNSFSKADKFDEFQKFMDNLLANSIGNRFHRYLQVEFPEIDDKVICHITVTSRSGEPVYLTNESGQETFYIRRLASTIDLRPSETFKYIQEHWL